MPAIEEAIFAGVPINVTLLFSREHYVAAAEAYLRGVERRIAAGLNPNVGSVASLFISRWDAAVAGKLPEATEQPTRHSDRRNAATRPIAISSLRPVGSGPSIPAPARSGCCWPARAPKIPKASGMLYVKALAAPLTVNTMPEGTLKAFADHGEMGASMQADGGDCEEVLARLRRLASTSTRWRRNSRMKARSHSSSPGTN